MTEDNSGKRSTGRSTRTMGHGLLRKILPTFCGSRASSIHEHPFPIRRVMARALMSETHGKPDGLAWFDVGYLMECFEQANLMQDIPGYELVMNAMRLRGDDPHMEFACALITKWPSRDKHHEHLRKATAEAKNGSLLAANVALHFRRSGGSR